VLVRLEKHVPHKPPRSLNAGIEAVRLGGGGGAAGCTEKPPITSGPGVTGNATSDESAVSPVSFTGPSPTAMGQSIAATGVTANFMMVMTPASSLACPT
jgi:hypothetical protein